MRHLAAHGVDGFVYHYRYEFGHGDKIMPWMVLYNLSLASVTILCVCALFLPVHMAVLCATTVACIDVMVLGAMRLHGVHLHSMTAIILLISLGRPARTHGA